MLRRAPHIASRLLAVFAALALLLTAVVRPAEGAVREVDAIEALTTLDGLAWAIDLDIDLQAVEHEVFDDDEAELGEGDDEVHHAAQGLTLRVRRPRTVRARGPPALHRWARLTLTRAPRGPPLA